MTDDAPFAQPASPTPASDEWPPELLSEQTAAQPAEQLAEQRTQKSSRRGLVIALVIALVLMVTFGALSAYLWSVHSQYVAQNEELRDTASGLGSELATSRALAEDVQGQLDDTNAQLEAAKATVKDLANSEAHAGDDRQALLDIASGLQQCADARQNLIDHLKEASKWTTKSLRDYESSTTTYCNKLIKAYRSVKDE